MNLPPEMEVLRCRVLSVLEPLRPFEGELREWDHADHRTAAGRSLPAYYLVYFLLVDFLKFRNLGRAEKVAWEIPIDFHGVTFSVSHRKMGLGLFANGRSVNEFEAQKQVKSSAVW